MANEQNRFIEGADIENYIVLYGGRPIDGFTLDGEAIASAKLNDAEPPVEGSGGYLCRGAQASSTEVLTLTMLRGTSGEQILKAAAGKEARTFSASKKGALPGAENRYFSDCAYVESNEGGINLGRGQDKTVEYTMYVTRPINNELSIFEVI